MMQAIKNLIICNICKSRLVDPIILPCGQTVCSSHTSNLALTSFECILCSKSHDIPQDGFIKNLSISKALSTNIDCEFFGAEYLQARESLEKLDKTLNEYKLVYNDKLLFLYEFFSTLENRVDLCAEIIRVSLDEKFEQVRAKIKKYKNECEQNLGKHTFVNGLDDIQVSIDESRRLLDALILDKSEWHSICEKTSLQHAYVANRMEKLKSQLLLERSASFVMDNFFLVREFGDVILDIPDPILLMDEKKEASLKDNLLNEIFTLQSLYTNRYLSIDLSSRLMTNEETPTKFSEFSFFRQNGGDNKLLALKAIWNEKFVSVKCSMSVYYALANCKYNENAIDQMFNVEFMFFDHDIVSLRAKKNDCYMSAPTDLSNLVGFRETKIKKRTLFRLRKVLKI